MIEAKKIVFILALGIACYIVAMVILGVFTKGDDEAGDGLASPPGEKTGAQNRIVSRPAESPEPNPSSFASPAITNTRVPNELAPPAEIPEGQTPAGIALNGEITIDKCWDSSGLEHPAGECDGLKSLETRLYERLYIMDQCRAESCEENTFGTLDLGVEVDFANSTLSFWSKPTSRMNNAVETAACIKERLRALRLPLENPGFARYQHSMSIRFFDGARAPEPATTEPSVDAAELPGKGAWIEVAKDRVRIRKRPVDGEVVCKISSGSRVYLLDKQDDWCLVRTQAGSVGWMICWGLASMSADAGI